MTALLERIIDRAEEAQVPFEVMFEVTHRCNLPCAHCYLPDHLDHGELSLPEIAALFDDLAAAGTFFLTLTGGEILSRRDFREIVDLAYERGFALKLLTNATMVTDELAAFFKQRNVLQVSVSLYGASAEVHDGVTGVPGSFERTLAGIDRLRAHGLKVFLKTVVLTTNVEGARDVHELARLRDMPCNYELAISARTDGNTSPLDLHVNRDRLVELLQQKPFDDLFAVSEHPGPSPCSAGKRYAAIGPTGNVMGCIMMPAPVGNVRERSFNEIWTTAPFFSELRALQFEDLHQCRSCDVKAACSRCPGSAMTRGQGPDGCDLTAKEVARARVAAHRLRVIQ